MNKRILSVVLSLLLLVDGGFGQASAGNRVVPGGTNTFKAINGIQTLNGNIYFSDQYASVPAAYSACNAAGAGGLVYSIVPGTQNITAVVNVGTNFNIANPCMGWGGVGVVWNIQTQGHQPGVRTYDAAGLRGMTGTFAFQGAGAFEIKQDPVSCVSSLIENGDQDGSQQETTWEFIWIHGSLTHSGAGNCQEDTALAHVRGLADTAYFNTLYIDNMTGIGLLIDAPTGFSVAGGQAFATTNTPCSSSNGICRTSNVVTFNVPPGQDFVNNVHVTNDPDSTGLFNGAGVIISGCTGGNGATYNRGAAAANVSAISESGTTVTVTFTSGGNFAVGESVILEDFTPSAYNGQYTAISPTSGTTLTFTSPTSGIGAGSVLGKVGAVATMLGPHSFTYTEAGQTDDTGASVTGCLEQPVVHFAGTTPFILFQNIHAIGTHATGQKPIMITMVPTFSAGVVQGQTTSQVNVTFEGGNAQSPDPAGGDGAACAWSLSVPCWGAFTIDGLGSSGGSAPEIIAVSYFHTECGGQGNCTHIAIKDANGVQFNSFNTAAGGSSAIWINCNTNSTTYNINFDGGILITGTATTNVVKNACNGTTTWTVAAYGKSWRWYHFGGNASNNCAAVNAYCGIGVNDRTHDVFGTGDKPNLAQTGNLGAQTVVAAAQVNALSHWQFNWSLEQNALCTAGSGTVSITFSWTGANASYTNTPANTLAITNTTRPTPATGVMDLWSAAGSAITYTTTLTAGTCTGTPSYDVHVQPIQVGP